MTGVDAGEGTGTGKVLKPQPSVVMEEDDAELEKQQKEFEGGAALTSANLAAANADASPQQAWAVIDFGTDGNLHALEEEQGHTAGSNMSRSVDWPALPASGGKNASSAHGSGANNAYYSGTPGGPDIGGGGPMVQTWILMEYCDRGCLQEAIDRGWLRTERSALSGGPNVSAVVATAREVASALAYLHQSNVVHGDLSGWNVMLCSAGAAATVGGRGFVAKVADFGLSRTLEIRSKMQTANYGTLSHMPPELVMHGTVSKAVDVYSFGILLWQMYTGSRPWSGLTHSQIIMLIGSGEARLVFPPGTPACFEALMRDCTARDPEQRPSFPEVVKRLDAMAAALEETGSME